jgi:hypothetical protein
MGGWVVLGANADMMVKKKFLPILGTKPQSGTLLSKLSQVTK